MLSSNKLGHHQGWFPVSLSKIFIIAFYRTKEVKPSELDVSFSRIIPRKDNWNNEETEINSYLKDLCESNDIPFISSTTINLKKHLNNSRLHLRQKAPKNFTIIMLGMVAERCHSKFSIWKWYFIWKKTSKSISKF